MKKVTIRFKVEQLQGSTIAQLAQLIANDGADTIEFVIK